MKTGVVYFSGSKNLGDDIQSYAMSKLVDNPEFLERENLNANTNSIKALISGWFMHKSENFPPSDKIDPLFVSFHAKQSIINKKNYSYFKKHEPIGCRDFDTLRLLQNLEVKAYFSGCATLTIDPPDGETERGNEIIVVDLLRKNYSTDYRNVIKKNIIPKEWRNKVSYFSHFIEDLPTRTIEERMVLVQEVLSRYAKAKLVVTSLIHCALPCIAMGTPVLFIDFGFDQKQIKRDRFEGIIDLMNIYDDFQSPFSKRNYFNAGLRILRLHRLFKHKIKPIPAKYFEKPLKNPEGDKQFVVEMKLKIQSFLKENN